MGADKDTKIYIQLKDQNSSWQIKKGFVLTGDRIGTVDSKDERVKAALKMKIIVKVEAPKPAKEDK